MDFLTMFLVGCILAALSFDVHKVWRYYLVRYICMNRRKSRGKKLLDENEFNVICLSTDLDFQGNMTQSRILRECTFGQLEFTIDNFLDDALKVCRAVLRNEEYHVTYIRPIRMLETFKIKTKIIYWDDENIYVQQSLVLNKDKTICAEILTRQKLTNANTRVLFEHMKENIEWPETFKDNIDKVKCVQQLLIVKS